MEGQREGELGRERLEAGQTATQKKVKMHELEY